MSRQQLEELSALVSTALIAVKAITDKTDEIIVTATSVTPHQVLDIEAMAEAAASKLRSCCGASSELLARVAR